MDYSKITLGELLSSPIETIRRNAIAILKTLQKKECEHIRKNGLYFTGDCPICNK